MWYSATGSCINLKQHEKDFLVELSTCLFSTGWSLRTGGRGMVDDVMHNSIVNLGGRVNTFVPFAHYRGYDAHRFAATTISFADEPTHWQGLALAKVEGDSNRLKFKSELAKNLLGCSVPILTGTDFNLPSRFVITWQNSHQTAEGNKRDDFAHHDPGLFNTAEAPIYYLARSRQVPVFNLANPLHMERIRGFIEKNRIRMTSQV
jgi:hypothetical protein